MQPNTNISEKSSLIYKTFTQFSLIVYTTPMSHDKAPISNFLKQFAQFEDEDNGCRPTNIFLLQMYCSFSVAVVGIF